MKTPYNNGYNQWRLSTDNQRYMNKTNIGTNMKASKYKPAHLIAGARYIS